MQSDDEKQVKLTDLIAEHIHSEEFFQSILDDIEAIKNKPDAKVKLKYELMNYIIPKIKAKDGEETQGIESIEINFIEAVKPEEEDIDEKEDS